MSRENVEVIRSVPNAPDPTALHGHAGVRRLGEMVDDSFVGVRLEVDRFVEGDEVVVALGEMRARGRGSGVEIPEARAWVWMLRDGRVIRHETHAHIDAALTAAGLVDRDRAE